MYKFNCKKENKVVFSFDADILDNDIIVNNVYDITEDAPFLIYEAWKNNFSQLEKSIIVKNFIKDRSISNLRIDLDEYLSKRLNLRKDINCYRLYNSQYILTILNGGISPFDKYYIVPQEEYLFSLININPKFWNIWLLKEKEYSDYIFQNEQNPDKYIDYVYSNCNNLNNNDDGMLIGCDCIPSEDKSFCFFMNNSRVIYLLKSKFKKRNTTNLDMKTTIIKISNDELDAPWCTVNSYMEFLSIKRVREENILAKFAECKKNDIIFLSKNKNDIHKVIKI